MSAISDLYAMISEADGKLLRKWQRETNKRIRRFVKNIAGASPFLDKPTRRMFGVRNSKDGQSLTIYGTSPNAGRMKAFHAPTNEWKQTTENYRLFGENGWRTIHKVQMVRPTAGVPIQDVPYFGTSNKPEQYFGIKKGRITLAYGKNKDNIALPVYARDSYPDWIMQNYLDDLETIIMEAGQDTLADYIGGKQ